MDISSLRERENGGVFSVSALNDYIKNIFESNRTLTAVTVKGEISNFINHRSGHFYFSLKDAEGQIRAVMFRSSVAKLVFAPENGMKVIAFGSVSVYPRDGSYQLYITSLQPDGVGALSLAYEQLRRKLADEGLFDEAHKLPIPRYPSRIGVITAPGGAAVRDIINVTGRRYPLADVYIYPVLVQGDGAEGDMVKALDWFEMSRLADVIIIGRGGGSQEDLWAFNGERLARKIYSMTVPVISAVGHETDFTICDFVSDLRAPTPTGAAELSVPDAKELRIQIDSSFDRLKNALDNKLSLSTERFLHISEKVSRESMIEMIDDHGEALETLMSKARQLVELNVERSSARMAALCAKLDALSPMGVIKRGYSVVKNGDNVVSLAQDIKSGDDIKLTFSDGDVYAKVKTVSLNEV